MIKSLKKGCLFFLFIYFENKILLTTLFFVLCDMNCFSFFSSPLDATKIIGWPLLVGNVLCLQAFPLIYVDLENLKDFCKSQGSPEADDLNHWDITFWSERLRESKYELNEVGRLSISPPLYFCVQEKMDLESNLNQKLAWGFSQDHKSRQQLFSSTNVRYLTVLIGNSKRCACGCADVIFSCTFFEMPSSDVCLSSDSWRVL